MEEPEEEEPREPELPVRILFHRFVMELGSTTRTASVAESGAPQGFGPSVAHSWAWSASKLIKTSIVTAAAKNMEPNT